MVANPLVVGLQCGSRAQTHAFAQLLPLSDPVDGVLKIFRVIIVRRYREDEPMLEAGSRSTGHMRCLRADGIFLPTGENNVICLVPISQVLG